MTKLRKRNKLVFDVGINDADYVVQVRETISYLDRVQKQRLIWICPFYLTWTSMLQRGYSKSFKERRPTYDNTSVCEEWHLFSNFKSWMEQQPWEGMELDKDILLKGNKEYNHTTCTFVPHRINSLLLGCGNARGIYPLGVSYKKKSKTMASEYKKPYMARINIGRGESKHLGLFATPQEAHKVWQLAKADTIDEAVNWWKNDTSVNHAFRQEIANALFERSEYLRCDVKNSIETIDL